MTCHDCCGCGYDEASAPEIDISEILHQAELAGLLPAEWAACDDARRRWRGLIEAAVERAT